jgi:Spy/CpxP family protein refolding chaperone
MKKIILSIALVTGLTSAINAQENSASAANTANQTKKDLSPEERAKAGAKHQAKKLGLSPEQTTKWEAAVLERNKANEPFREKMKGSTTPEQRKEIHTSVKANNEKFDNTVNTFLTPEQKTKWEAEKKEKRDRHLAKFKGKKGSEEPHIDLED